MLFQHATSCLCFIVGTFGNCAALYILNTTSKARNRKQVLLLNCLAINDLVAMVGMLAMILINEYAVVEKEYICKGFVLLRAFGVGSGCIALIMAVERWLALTKPFLYQQIVTYELLFRCLVGFWIISATWTFLPLVGFGSYYKDGACSRYRDATTVRDKIYAYLFFVFGTTLLLCISLLNMVLVWALSRMKSSRRVLIRRVSKSILTNNGTTYSHRTPEEIAFSKLMSILCITFVVCWAPQMICIPLVQFYRNDYRIQRLSRLADFLMAIYFTLDPYIYVVYRYLQKSNVTFCPCGKGPKTLITFVPSTNEMSSDAPTVVIQQAVPSTHNLNLQE
ncbi:prostaglandin E2 receptor EP3 subtype [Harmonia axyridis]|uniref:prostaglandin E2 receptor EP3 subtype n=1 Tax=Harmonia axyridis TaxID=115357 RepID=UPI001E279AE7|nr:prostaglandin E2 receptor EP3 subtype [Harmonia axyridis]XP_045482234.1 prostaglandin E2 receptor EP3 subtype [Harmonia axyridis]XP_045482235.1 prostaglandin E2 receptor EP3 subtype [Harmonia axyridis]